MTAWVTCVPSLPNPDLVPDFANRLAAWSGIAGGIREKGQTEICPQKSHERTLIFFLAQIMALIHILTCKIPKTKERCNVKFSYNKNVF